MVESEVLLENTWLKNNTVPLSARRNATFECLADAVSHGAQTETWEPTEEDMKYIREKSQVTFKIRFKEEGTYFDLANLLQVRSITRSLRYAWVIVDLENKSYTEDLLSSISEVESWEVLE